MLNKIYHATQQSSASFPISIAILGTIAGVMGFASQATAVSMYQVTDLGVLGIQSSGYSNSFTGGINNFAQVVGGSTVTSVDRDRAFFWDSTSGMQNLGVLPGFVESYALGINNVGQTVGPIFSANGASRAFLWDSINGMQNLGVLGKLPRERAESRAFDINDVAQVVGWSTSANGTRAFLWDSTNGMQNLGVLGTSSSGSSLSDAYGINNLGQVVGRSISVNGQRAFLWDSANAMQDLGFLEFSRFGFASSSAREINDLGQVVGTSTVYSGERAFLWDSVNGMQNLGVLGATCNGFYCLSYSNASGINNRAQVVGYSTSANGNTGFLWEDGVMYNLNNVLLPDSEWVMLGASDINDKGQIAGYGYSKIDKRTRALLLTPIPEPLSFLGVGTALGFGIVFKRKLRKG